MPTGCDTLNGTRKLLIPPLSTKNAHKTQAPFKIPENQNVINSELLFAAIRQNEKVKCQSPHEKLTSAEKIEFKMRYFRLHCQYQQQGWVEGIKWSAEFANFLSRAGTYAAMGAFTGGVVGSFIFFPGFGTLGGAAGGALAGLLYGVIVSGVSILCKIIANEIKKSGKNRGLKNSVEILKNLNSDDAIQNAQALSQTLDLTEKKMLKRIERKWMREILCSKEEMGKLDKIDKALLEYLNKKIEKINGKMNLIMDECILGQKEEHPLIIKTINKLRERVETKLNKSNIVPPSQSISCKNKSYKQDSILKALTDQLKSYILVRSPSGLLGSQLQIPNLAGDIISAIIFPVFTLFSVYIDCDQGKAANQIRKIMSHPVAHGVNITIGILSTLACFLPDIIGSCIHDIHTFNVFSLIFSVIIHAVKEVCLSLKDLKIKDEIDKYLDEDGEYDCKIVGEKMARLVRHYVSKNIPNTLNKLASLAKEIEDCQEKEKLEKLSLDFNVSESLLNSYLDTVQKYESFNNDKKKRPYVKPTTPAYC